MSIKASSISIPNNYKNTQFGKAIETLLNREIDSYSQRYKTALTKAMKQIGQQAVLDWYSASGFSTGADVTSALRVESAFVRNTKSQKIVRLTSYFDETSLDAMSEYYESAVRWNVRHSDICNYSPGTYVFLLRWEHGYLNLPDRARATDSGWVNDNCQISQLGSLKSFFATALKNDLTTVTNSLVRNRNTNMGAGATSSNRSGIKNLVHGKAGGN